MKLIIDVPENKNYTQYFKCMSQQLDKTLNEGIPIDDVFDKIRAEIEEIKTDTMYKYVGDFRYGVDTVVEIIDKYRNEVTS